MLQKIKCLFGFHKWETPILVSLDTYWLQGHHNSSCSACGKLNLTNLDYKKYITIAYERGKERGATEVKARYSRTGNV